MRRFALIALAIAATLVFAPSSQGAKAPSNAALARQIKTLQKQVKTLQTQVREARLIGLSSLAYAGCVVAVSADAFQGTWATIDSVAGRPIYGPQQPLNDFGLCQALEFNRTPSQVPPNTSVFNAMLAVFR